MDDSKKMWSSPWGYRESLVLAAALVAGGFTLQLILGPVNLYLFHRPGNLILAGFIVLAALISLPFKKTGLVRWLAGVPWAVSLLLAFLLLSLAMGLTPQARHIHGLPARLGLNQLTSSWPLGLAYLATLFSLALVTAGRLFPFQRRNLVFILNHLGLWLLFLAAGLGAADRVSHVMYVEQGQLEWRVYSRDGQALELPLAIRLDKFEMEEYPPRLAVIDRRTGVAQPESSPRLFQVDSGNPGGRLLDWDLTVLNYLYQAVPGGEGQYRAADMPASAQAVEVKAVNRLTLETRQGWVSAGNRFLSPAPLVLSDDRLLVMAQPEPKRFTSKIKVFTRAGLELESFLEVNRPLRAGDWLIYQYGYDNQAGRMSNYSSFLLVFDPWLTPAHAGLALWALGAIGLIFQGRRRKASET
jgi:hypothetical protein